MRLIAVQGVVGDCIEIYLARRYGSHKAPSRRLKYDTSLGFAGGQVEFLVAWRMVLLRFMLGEAAVATSGPR